MSMRLASPGYNKSALVSSLLAPVKEQMIEFKGLNRKSYIEAGEMSDMLNLSCDDYPLLSPRKPRGIYPLPSGLVRPLQILARHNRLAIIGTDSNGDVKFWYDNNLITEVDDLNYASSMTAINTKICFFPQKTYLEVIASGSSVTIGDYGHLEAKITLTSAEVTISNVDCRLTLPADPGNPGFKYDDALNIKGTLSYTPSGGTVTTRPCEVSCIIEDVADVTSGDKRVLVLPRETFIELTGEGASGITLTGTDAVSRTMPDLDYVIEWNNRLWGASNADNTVYASKLGDPTNWQYYQGTSLDSFYAQQGTDGMWSGVGAYSGHIIFFKPAGMCRVYGTAPSNYQVTSTKCYGVEEGSSLSVVTINDTVFYKSQIGIMAYQGGIPVCISDKLGQDFANVTAGSEGIKYYASCQRRTNEGGFEVLVYDIDKNYWHRENHADKEKFVRFKGSCSLDNRLHFIEYNEPELVCSDNIFCDPFLVMGDTNKPGGITIINPQDPAEKYEDIDWMAQFGPFHEYLEEKKIYSKLSLRLKANDTSEVKVYIALDEGEWELVKEYTLAKTSGEVIPIIPRRCDRYSIRIEGKGNCEIVSLTRRVREGTFGKL